MRKETNTDDISRRKLLQIAAYSVPAMTIINVAGAARALAMTNGGGGNGGGGNGGGGNGGGGGNSNEGEIVVPPPHPEAGQMQVPENEITVAPPAPAAGPDLPLTGGSHQPWLAGGVLALAAGFFLAGNGRRERKPAGMNDEE